MHTITKLDPSARPRKTETDPPPPFSCFNDHSAVIYLNILHLFRLPVLCSPFFSWFDAIRMTTLRGKNSVYVYFPKDTSTYKSQKYSKSFYYLNIQNGRQMEENIVDINIILYVKPKVRFTCYVSSVLRQSQNCMMPFWRHHWMVWKKIKMAS